MGDCKFDTLLTKSVPHILEKIFLNLDLASFMNCMEVDTVWHELLTSKSYKRLGRLMFHCEIDRELWIAASEGNAGEVRRLILTGMVDINYKQDRWAGGFVFRNETPLFSASEKGFQSNSQTSP